MVHKAEKLLSKLPDEVKYCYVNVIFSYSQYEKTCSFIVTLADL